MMAYQEQREAWITKYPHFAESAKCQTCFDTKWLKDDPPINHPQFGKLTPCPDCTGASYYSQFAGLADQEIRELDWSKVIDTDNAGEAKEAVKETLARGHGWVFLHGGPGIAKSLILRIAIAETIRDRKNGTYVNMSEIIDNLREGYDSDRPQSEAIRRLKNWTAIHVLAIDEFDKVKDTEYVTERRMRILDERYVAATRQEHSITLIASNQPPDYFDSYITDRIKDGRFAVIELTGGSKRPGIRWEERSDLR